MLLERKKLSLCKGTSFEFIMKSKGLKNKSYDKMTRGPWGFRKVLKKVSPIILMALDMD